MSSFKPSTTSLPQKFQKPGASDAISKQRPKDRLCIINGYEVDAKSILATEVATGRTIRFKIDPARSFNASNTTSWTGSAIDARMAEHLKVDSWAVLEQCKTMKKGGETAKGVVPAEMVGGWVSSVPDASPDKAFTCRFTVSMYRDAIASVQVWESRAINPQTDEGAAEIAKIAAQLDENIKLEQAGLHPVNIGVQFRAMLPIRDAAGVITGYNAFNQSPPMDWIRPERDAAGTVTSGNHPLTGEDLNSFLEGYMDYIYGSVDQSADDAQPGLVAEGSVDPALANDIVVEVTKYNVYTGAPLSEKLKVKNESSPLYRLANHVVKYSVADDDAFVGKNWGVDGIVLLTADKRPEKRGEDFTARNLVHRVYTNGFTAAIQSMIEASDGLKVKLDPALIVAPAPTPGSAVNEQGSGSQAPAADAGFSFATATPPGAVNPFEDDGGFDFAAEVAKAVPETVAASPEPAPPAADPSPEAAKVDAPAPPAPRANNFRRGTTASS